MNVHARARGTVGLCLAASAKPRARGSAGVFLAATAAATAANTSSASRTVSELSEQTSHTRIGWLKFLCWATRWGQLTHPLGFAHSSAHEDGS